MKTGGPYSHDFVFGSEFLPGAGSTNDITMFFDMSKAAFRTGGVLGSAAWCPDSIGFYSVATGLNTTARGDYSVAMGLNNAARGIGGAVFGAENTVSGDQGFAAGSENTVGGDDAASLGLGNLVAGNLGMSWGTDNVVLGALGTAWGDSTRAEFEGSTAWGKASIAGAPRSTVWGYYTLANGENSTAWGLATHASGFNGTAWGRTAFASGENATAWGRTAFASGENATAWGRATFASGKNSTGWGHGSTASGDYSTAFGYRAGAKTFAAVTIGQYNEEIAGNETSWNSLDPILEVGIGTSPLNRRNALTILKNGTISFEDYTFPNNDGTGGYVMKTDGSGTLTWELDEGVFRNYNGAVRNSGSGSDDFVFGLDSLPAAGAVYTKNLFFFDESQGAFRAGGLTNSNTWQPGDLGQFSIGLGEDSEASGDNSLAIGQDAVASGLKAIAVGTNVDASAEGSVALGTDATSTSIHGVAIGKITSAEGNYALAMGNNTSASGVHASAFGWKTYAIGDFSTTFGQYINGNAFNTFVVGRYNIGGGNATSWVATDPLFEIGNGSGFGVDASNALTVLKNGNTGIGTNTPEEPLSVVGVIRGAYTNAEASFIEIGHGGNNAFINADGVGNIDIRHGDANIMTLTSTKRVGIKTNNPDCELHIVHANSGGSAGFKVENTSTGDHARLYVSSSSGNLRIYTDNQANAIGNFDEITGTYSATSDRRLKENFEDLRFDWDSFMNLQALMYEYKSDERNEKHVGMIAQDVMEVYPEIVTYDEEDDIYTMNYSAFGVIAIKAIQEQQDEIKRLEEQIALQQESQKALEARLSRLEQALTADTSVD